MKLLTKSKDAIAENDGETGVNRMPERRERDLFGDMSGEDLFDFQHTLAHHHERIDQLTCSFASQRLHKATCCRKFSTAQCGSATSKGLQERNPKSQSPHLIERRLPVARLDNSDKRSNYAPAEFFELRPFHSPHELRPSHLLLDAPSRAEEE